eukprot:scaffold3151_cov110-Cylindrotheca_fusiformis.AAC.14
MQSSKTRTLIITYLLNRHTMFSNIDHAQAMNLARRHSVRAENDLLQESYADSISEETCTSLLRQLKLDSIPKECHEFASFRAAWRRHTSENHWDPKAYEGMDAREALEAQSAREHGRLNNAQILRRMSTRHKENERSWF